MKDWFNYEYGYVNIDSDNLFLTNSGNWSETKDLTEKTKKVTEENDTRSSLILGFIIIVFCAFAFMMYKSFISGKLGLTLIVLVIAGGYKLYNYLKTEIGSKFKIPLEKITEITIFETSAQITFIDAEGLQSNYVLRNVDEKGKNILHSIKMSKK